MHLVVAANELSLRVDEGGGVEEVVAACVVGGAVHADVACDDGRAGLAGEFRERCAELRVVLLKGRGRFRPDDEVCGRGDGDFRVCAIFERMLAEEIDRLGARKLGNAQ